MSQIVRKTPIQVEISRVGHPLMTGAVFLVSRGRPGSESETLPGFLNRGGNRMIPFERRPDGAMLLISSRQLEWVRPVSREWVVTSPADPGSTREELIRVRLCGGSDVEGFIEVNLESSFFRASDFLNSNEPFLSVQTPTGPCYVNKESILEVQVFELSPIPPFRESAK